MSNIAVILAAGAGTRMRSDLPKVAHLLSGKPLVRWVIDAARAGGCERIVTVVGYGREIVEPLVADTVTVVQAERLGTGHAVMMAREELEGVEGTVVVLCGDAPLISSETIATLIAEREQSGAAACLLTMVVDDPTGYGRIVRDADGNIRRIVEQKDCTPEEAAITECNSGFYCFDAQTLLEALGSLRNDNAQQEYYLTDCVGICVERGLEVRGIVVADNNEALGINSPEQLASVQAIVDARTR